MAAYGITFDDVCQAAKNAQSNTGGGIVNKNGTEVAIRNIGRSADIKDIADAVVKTVGGKSVLIKDVAETKIDKAVLRGDSAVDGREGIVLTLTKQPDTDTLKITKDVENAIAEISKNLPDGVELKIVYRQDEFINSAIDNVETAIRDGRDYGFHNSSCFSFQNTHHANHHNRDTRLLRHYDDLFLRHGVVNKHDDTRRACGCRRNARRRRHCRC